MTVGAILVGLVFSGLAMLNVTCPLQDLIESAVPMGAMALGFGAVTSKG